MTDYRDLPPAVQELFKMLLEPGADFSVEARTNFLRAAACIFYIVYGPSDSIRIERGADGEQEREGT